MPKPRIELIARGVLLREGRLLVCEYMKGKYQFLPGGHVEFGESGETALIREMMEETGQVVTVGRFLGVFEASFDQAKENKPSKRHHEINLIYEMATENSEPIASIESEIAFRWVAIDDLRAGRDFRPAAILDVALGGVIHAGSMSE